MTNRAKLVAAMLTAATVASQGLAQDFGGAFYGGSIGLGTGTYLPGTPENDLTAAEIDVEGIMVGARIGGNVQNGRTLYGVDAEISTGIDGSNPVGTNGSGWDCATGPCNITINAIGTLRARAGYLIDSRTVIYGAGGVAIAAVEGGIENSPQQGSSITGGGTFAVGIERFMSPVTMLFAEAAVIDLGTLTFGTDDSETYDYTADGDILSLRVGLNVKF